MGSPPSLGHEKAQQDICTGVSTALTILSIAIVGMRTYSRTLIVRNFGSDDWMMLVALMFTVGYLITIWILRDNGMGFSGATLTLEEMTNLVKATLAIETMYYIIIFSIKASILFFYLRIAAEKAFARRCKITIAVLAVFCGICVICCVTQCVPIHKMWDFTGLVEGKCINTTALFYFTSSFNILTDIWILALPIKTLMSIQRPNREKAALVAIFSLGVFSCIASIVRLHSIRIFTESTDPFYDSVPVNVWSMVEVNIGIYCASIPALKAIFVRTQGGTQAFGYRYHSRGKSGTAKMTGSRKIVGGSSSDQSRGTVHMIGDGFDMKPLDSDSVLQHPRQAAKGHAYVDLDGEEVGSQERIIHIMRPGADKHI